MENVITYANFYVYYTLLDGTMITNSIQIISVRVIQSMHQLQEAFLFNVIVYFALLWYRKIYMCFLIVVLTFFELCKYLLFAPIYIEGNFLFVATLKYKIVLMLENKCMQKQGIK